MGANSDNLLESLLPETTKSEMINPVDRKEGAIFVTLGLCFRRAHSL